MIQTKRLLCLATLILGGTLAAAPDTIDSDFAGTAGSVYRDNTGDFGSVASLLVQPDGKILVGSNEMATTLVEGDDLFAPLIRFNPDGTVDNTFFADANAVGEGSGIVFVGAGWPEVMALGLQSDGKIIAGGVMTGMNDGTNNVLSRNLVRINPDGTVDPTFQTAGTQAWITGNLNYISDLIVDPDDRIVIAGAFRGVRNTNSDPFTARHGLARLNADGSLDASFALDPVEFGVPAGAGSLRGIIYQVSRDSAGGYYIAGDFEWNGGSTSIVARIRADGARDFSFDPVLPTGIGWRGVAVEADGRVVGLGYLVPGSSSVMLRQNCSAC